MQLDGVALPRMPDATLQVNTVGQAGAGAIEEAWAFAAQCLARVGTAPDVPTITEPITAR